MSIPPGKHNPEKWTLTFTAAPSEDNPPMCVRIRRLLKAALRSYSLKCVDITTKPQEDKPDGAG